jgi:hypothetical protein
VPYTMIEKRVLSYPRRVEKRLEYRNFTGKSNPCFFETLKYNGRVQSAHFIPQEERLEINEQEKR